MSKEVVGQFLKKRQGEQFTAEQLANILNIKKRTVWSILRQLEKENSVLLTNTISDKGGYKVTKYEHLERLSVDKSVDEMRDVKSRYDFINSETISNVMILDELRSLRRDIVELMKKGYQMAMNMDELS